MSVHVEESGLRWVQVETDLPGDPVTVWNAVATGPGIGAWFVPCDIEGRERGRILFHLGPDVDSEGTVTIWDPPRHFSYDEPGWEVGMPPLSTEITIAEGANNTSKLRLVHRLRTRSTAWDGHLTSMEEGWPSFFRILKAYLIHFPGRPCHYYQVAGQWTGNADGAWKALLSALDLNAVESGQGVNFALGESTFEGRALHVNGTRDGLILLDSPEAGLALFSAYSCDGPVQVAISFYLYGEEAERLIASESPRWEAWMEKAFPPVQPKTEA